MPQNLFGADAAEEEELKKITLRGINQRGGSMVPPRQPAQARGLYQYDPAGSGLISHRIAAIRSALPTNVSSAATVECDAPYRLALRVALYLGDVDYYPTSTTARRSTPPTTTLSLSSSPIARRRHAGVTVRVNKSTICPPLSPSNVSSTGARFQRWRRACRSSTRIAAPASARSARVNRTMKGSRTGSRARGG